MVKHKGKFLYTQYPISRIGVSGKEMECYTLSWSLTELDTNIETVRAATLT